MVARTHCPREGERKKKWREFTSTGMSTFRQAASVSEGHGASWTDGTLVWHETSISHFGLKAAAGFQGRHEGLASEEGRTWHQLCRGSHAAGYWASGNYALHAQGRPCGDTCGDTTPGRQARLKTNPKGMSCLPSPVQPTPPNCSQVPFTVCSLK